jgi:hypothetical protein
MFDSRHAIRLSLMAMTMVAVVTLCGCGSNSSDSPLGPGPIDQAPPLPPSGARIDWQMHGKFALAWDKNSEPDLAGYRVYLYSPDPSRGNSYECLSGAGLLSRNSLTVAGTVGTEYIFRVTAVDASNNESPMGGAVRISFTGGGGDLPAEQGDGTGITPGSSSGGRSGSNDTPMDQGGGEIG